MEWEQRASVSLVLYLWLETWANKSWFVLLLPTFPNIRLSYYWHCFTCMRTSLDFSDCCRTLSTCTLCYTTNANLYGVVNRSYNTFINTIVLKTSGQGGQLFPVVDPKLWLTFNSISEELGRYVMFFQHVLRDAHSSMPARHCRWIGLHHASLAPAVPSRSTCRSWAFRSLCLNAKTHSYLRV